MSCVEPTLSARLLVRTAIQLECEHDVRDLERVFVGGSGAVLPVGHNRVEHDVDDLHAR